jgi:hypothetical protein
MQWVAVLPPSEAKHVELLSHPELTSNPDLPMEDRNCRRLQCAAYFFEPLCI